MGGAIAEFLSQNYPTPIEFIGVKNKFGQSGHPKELYQYYEMAKEDIIKKVEVVLKRKIK